MMLKVKEGAPPLRRSVFALIALFQAKVVEARRVKQSDFQAGAVQGVLQELCPRAIPKSNPGAGPVQQ